MQKNSQKLNQRTASPILRNPKARYQIPILRNPKARYQIPILRNPKARYPNSDFKKSKSKISKSDFKKYDNKIKKDKKFKPSSISQGSSLTSFKSENIKNLDKDKLRNLGIMINSINFLEFHNYRIFLNAENKEHV